MQSDKPHGDGGAARPPSETAGQVAAAPPTHASQPDSPAFTSPTTSDRHAGRSTTAAQQQGGADSLKQPGEATEGAEQGEVGPALERAEETPVTTARSLAAPAAVDPEHTSMNLAATHGAPPDVQSVAVPFQSVFAIPRPASLTSRITEPSSTAASSTNGERVSTAEEGNAQLRAHIERQLGLRTTTEQEHHTQAHVLGQPPNGNSLLVLASATRSVSASVSGDDQHSQEAGEGQGQQRQQHESRKRPRSAGSGGGDDGRETDQGSQAGATFEPFPPGWHLDRASSNVQSGDEAGASPSSAPEYLEPASRRRRTEETAPGPVVGEASTTMQQLDQAHQEWRRHREATLRSLQAQAMAQNFTARHPPAASPSGGSSLPPSYESYSSIAPAAQAYPYGGTPPLLPPQAMMGGGGRNSTFSGRAGTTATTSTQWYAKGSVAETYHLAHEQQRGHSRVQGYPAPPAAADSDTAWQIGGVAPKQARSVYDLPRQPHPYTSSSSYYYGGVPGYVYRSRPQQQQQQRYSSPFPGPPGHEASSPSTPAATSSNTSSHKGGWSDHSSSARMTASTSVDTSSSSSSLLSRSAEAAETRNAIPIRTQSNLASIMRNAPSPSGSFSQGSEAPTPGSSSVLVGMEQGQAESQDPTSPVASGSGAGGRAASTGSGSKGRKPTGRRPAPANAYSIHQIQGVKPFIYKLRWLLQNPQAVGDVITWSNDGSAVLVKIGGGDDAMLKQMLTRTFSHENPGAFTRQFSVYGFTPIKDPEELAEVLDPATRPADAWRAYEDKSGTFHRDGLDDLDALKTMVAKKKGGGGSTTRTTSTSTTGPGRRTPAVQQRPQSQPSVGIPVQGCGEGTVLPSIPGDAIAATAGTGFPILQQGYWPPAATRSGDPHTSSSSSTTHYYQQQQQHASLSPSSGLASAVAGQYIHSAPKPVGAAQAQKHVGSRSNSEGSLGDWFRQAADVPRMGGGIESLLRGTEAVSMTAAATAGAGDDDDHRSGDAVGDVSGPAMEEEEEERGGSPAA